MRVSELGEFPLIDRIARIAAIERADVIVGIGDDVAVLETRKEGWLLAKVDSQVEGVHFRRETILPRHLGRRSLAINLSDIAAAGGQPQFALVSLALPPSIEVDWVDEFYRGLREEGDRYSVALVGGNMARSPGGVFVDVFVLGWVQGPHLLLRSGARPGDQVIVTGTLGDSKAGLSLLLDPSLLMPDEDRDLLLARHFTPTPRLAEAHVIASSGKATAMIDVSDGLSSDIGHICDCSQVGVRLWAERLPISPAARSVARLTHQAPWRLATEGGEDYELCFTVPAESVEGLIYVIEQETGTSVTVVGEVLPAEEGRWLVLEDGDQVPLEAKGWDHFEHQIKE